MLWTILELGNSHAFWWFTVRTCSYAIEYLHLDSIARTFLAVPLVIMWEKLRKFGMQYYDLPTMLMNVAFLFKALTLNIDSRFANPIPTICYVIAYSFAVIYNYTYSWSVVWFMLRKSVRTEDFVAAMIVFSLGIASKIGVAKFIYVYSARKELRLLIDEYLRCDAIVVPGSRFARNLLKVLKNVKKRAIIFWMIINGNGVMYILKPMLLPGRHSIENSFILHGLEPPLESPYYEATYFFMAIGTVVTCFLTSNITVLLIVITGYVEGQLFALSEELLNLYEDCNVQIMTARINFNDSNTKDLINNEVVKRGADYRNLNKLFEKRLREIIKIHVMNISMIAQVNKIFRGAFAVEFGVLSIGLIAELLGGLENTYIELPFAIIQVAMDCLIGQRLLDAGQALETAVYSCHWELLDASNMRTICLLLVNAQKKLTLSVGGVADLHFSCLMSSFRSIYSAFTALRSVV